MKIKRFYCSIEDCNKSFRSEEKLQAHAGSHLIQEESEEEELFFECEECNAKFPTRRSVSAHRRIHKLQRKPQISNKVIRMLSARLSSHLQSECSIAELPFSPDEIRLPGIGVPQEAVLPLLEELMKKEN